jgi:stage V sporulation protein R
MEQCKVRAKTAGLQFADETLEYIVTNRDLLELSPKVMIPTLYDYWVNDVEVLKEQGKYKLYPSNPYETVINSRPAISFYNDNNPDWMNVMIFYHVLGHIDFFQNNMLFQKTWNDDFVGQALADKRLIAGLRSEHGRWLDYAIEFSRNADNLVGYFEGILKTNFDTNILPSERVGFYFDVFLQEIVNVPQHELFKEIERYNQLILQDKDVGETLFFTEVRSRYPEFQAKFERHGQTFVSKPIDVMQFIQDNSPFLRNEKNAWIKSVLMVVRDTSLYFQPQIRTKIINEGWASYWHDELFRGDERVSSHETGYAKLNAGVTSISRVGLNPYAIGLRLIQYVEELGDKGKLNYEFQKIENAEQREMYDKKTGKGRETIFNLRKHFSDFMLINTFVDQDFVDKHNLFVVGKRLNKNRNVYEYYVKSRRAADYKQMLIDSLYHPPKVDVNLNKTNDGNLYLVHKFENKQLIKDFIPDTLLGVEFLWGGQVQLETTEIIQKTEKDISKLEYQKVLYTMKDKKVKKENIK